MLTQRGLGKPASVLAIRFIATFRGTSPLRLVALFRTRSAAVYGIDAHVIDVEVDMYPGAARISSRSGCRTLQCGRAASASSRRCSIPASAIPTRAVTINLAPANVRKEGAGFDLPMALGILGAMGTRGGRDNFLFDGRVVARRRGAAGARRTVDGGVRATAGRSPI